ncbi:serine threonine kinase [Fusarium longipes]|uniref:Serine threonine kinase n=1 Tax=Fusarium longipes TaxID=694270 RepID=A0A395T9Y4_9HYPO|nr:serine threonine kinase [Fusarium longipes]
MANWAVIFDVVLNGLSFIADLILLIETTVKFVRQQTGKEKRTDEESETWNRQLYRLEHERMEREMRKATDEIQELREMVNHHDVQYEVSFAPRHGLDGIQRRHVSDHYRAANSHAHDE